MDVIVRACFPFYDEAEKADRAVGDEFECTSERAEQINAAGYGDLVKVIRYVDDGKPQRKPKKAKQGDGE